ncbi:MAG: hypothetical protein Kow006_08010 [Gammaproteobacteria bacterium]
MATGIYLAGDYLLDQGRLFLSSHPERGAWLLGLLLVTYILFMAIPFMPGIEVGLVVMLAGGLEGVVTVYLATVLALCISYLCGSLVPGPSLAGLLNWLGLRRAAGLVREMNELEAAGRIRYLTQRAPARWVPFLLRHRYVALALLLNMPGNAVIGGGGGIGVTAGLSGLFPFPRYLLLVMVAVSPVPLFLIWQRLGQ